MKRGVANIIIVLILLICSIDACGGATSRLFRETGELIIERFGKGVAGRSAREVSETVARYSIKYGDDAVLFLRRTGHAGVRALEQAGDDSPKLLKLFAKNADEAVWLASRKENLNIFLKYGEGAGRAMYQHPGIAGKLIERYSDDAVGALNRVSRQGAQRMGMLDCDGVFSSTPQSGRLLKVIAKYGDRGLDFIWKHKGVLTGGVLLAAFIHNPKPYIDGTKELVGEGVIKPTMENIGKPIANSVNWTLILILILSLSFMPYIASSATKSIIGIGKEIKRRK